MARKSARTMLLLLLLATSGLWLRSGFYSETMLWGYKTGLRGLASDFGSLFYVDAACGSPAAPADEWPNQFDRCRASGFNWFQWGPARLELLGFVFVLTAPPLLLLVIGVPYWFICLVLTSPFTLQMLRAVRTRRRRKKGLCLECGYNWTGNVSGICPECGERIDPDHPIDHPCHD